MFFTRSPSCDEKLWKTRCGYAWEGLSRSASVVPEDHLGELEVGRRAVRQVADDHGVGLAPVLVEEHDVGDVFGLAELHEVLEDVRAPVHALGVGYEEADFLGELREPRGGVAGGGDHDPRVLDSCRLFTSLAGRFATTVTAQQQFLHPTQPTYEGVLVVRVGVLLAVVVIQEVQRPLDLATEMAQLGGDRLVVLQGVLELPGPLQRGALPLLLRLGEEVLAALPERLAQHRCTAAVDVTPWCAVCWLPCCCSGGGCRYDVRAAPLKKLSSDVCPEMGDCLGGVVFSRGEASHSSLNSHILHFQASFLCATREGRGVAAYVHRLRVAVAVPEVEELHGRGHLGQALEGGAEPLLELRQAPLREELLGHEGRVLVALEGLVQLGELHVAAAHPLQHQAVELHLQRGALHLRRPRLPALAARLGVGDAHLLRPRRPRADDLQLVDDAAEDVAVEVGEEPELAALAGVQQLLDEVDGVEQLDAQDLLVGLDLHLDDLVVLQLQLLVAFRALLHFLRDALAPGYERELRLLFAPELRRQVGDGQRPVLPEPDHGGEGGGGGALLRGERLIEVVFDVRDEAVDGFVV
ncbi:semaphorin-3F-like isoform X1 [Babesia caballi]|uniref:Semaphorin-3F-like isoform X1 n=1 Tax=Babesia caballi TaxID=5871 RepID=A0AAV4LRF9_BABCB|nr:semaphorin-3F-like isoform X1 [Babesia caballi]